MTDVDEDELKREWRSAFDDSRGQAYRRELCAGIAAAFREVGRTLWVGGWTIGPDRVAGDSPFGFGSDATVGLATVAQVAGELTAGAVVLLKEENYYAAAALVRQLVEAEYLAWAFAEDQDEAVAWLRSTKSERMNTWRPKRLQDRSQGRFRGEDYGFHCEQGGHPTPDSNRLLPGHNHPSPLSWWWYDLALHGTSAWKYIDVALANFDWDLLRDQPSAEALSRLIEGWSSNDPLPALSARTQDFLRARPPQ